MARTKSYSTQILDILKELKKQHPTQELSNHISGALSDYKDIWGISDKEFAFSLEKYQATLEIDKEKIEADDAYVDKIIKEGMNLDTLFDEDEDDDLDY